MILKILSEHLLLALLIGTIDRILLTLAKVAIGLDLKEYLLDLLGTIRALGQRIGALILPVLHALLYRFEHLVAFQRAADSLLQARTHVLFTI